MSLSLLIVAIFVILLCLHSATHHVSSFALPPSVCSVFVSFCDPSYCLCQKSVCWIGCCLILPHLLSDLVLVADCCIIFSPVCVASFLSHGLFTWSSIHARLLTLESMRFAPSLSGQAGELAAQSFFSFLSNFSACSAAALDVGCQSSVKASVM